jgi:Clusterin-associated protein-1
VLASCLCKKPNSLVLRTDSTPHTQEYGARQQYSSIHRVMESSLLTDADHCMYSTIQRICMYAQLSSIKEARALATDITDRGARLFDLLGKEREARRQRVKAAAFLEAAAAAGGSSSGACLDASSNCTS